MAGQMTRAALALACLAVAGCRGDERLESWRAVIEAPVTVERLPLRLGYCSAAASSATGDAQVARLVARCRASVPAMVEAARGELASRDPAARMDGCRHACAALALAGEGTPPVDEARRAVADACAGPPAPPGCAPFLAGAR